MGYFNFAISKDKDSKPEQKPSALTKLKELRSPHHMILLKQKRKQTTENGNLIQKATPGIRPSVDSEA